MAARLTLANSVNLSATVNLLHYARAIGLDWNRLGSIMPQLERMRYVDDVEDRHQFFIRLELETSRPDVAARRIAETLSKIERLLGRYRKESDSDCGQCEGTGTTDAMGAPEPCPVCDGTGKLKESE